MRIDLHTHSTASDGLLDPARLVQTAREQGVRVLALTDHDTTEGLDEALSAGAAYRVDVIPGVEINTDVGDDEVHILGYLIDYRAPSLQRFLAQLRGGRLARAQEMVRRLQAMGVAVEWTRVAAIAGDAAVGRPHIARALVEAGRVGSPREAFERFLGRHGPAYVPRAKVTPEHAVAVIAEHGGVPVLAHPGWASSGRAIDRLDDLIAHGLQGLEVYYPDHAPEMIDEYRRLADRRGLVATGGTDYHGGGLSTRVPLGSVAVPAGVVDELRARCRGPEQRRDG